MDAIGKKLEDMKAYWELHTKSMVNSPEEGSVGFSVETFDPMRVRFYLQVLSNSDKFRQILKEYDLGSTLRNTFHSAIKDIVSSGQYLNSLEDTDYPSKKDILEKVNKKLGANPLTESKFTLKTGGEPSYFEDKLAKFKAQEEAVKTAATPPASVDTIHNENKKLEQIVEGINANPIYSPQAKKTTTMDIVVFIVVTYLFRSLALFIVDWAIDSQMVSSMEQGFILYLGIYIILFVLLCLLVNTGPDEDALNPFKLLFYYINTDINSPARIYVHVVLQLLLLPIMFIVKDKTNSATGTQGQSTFEVRRTIISVLNNLTFFIWVISSIVASRL